MKRNQKLRIKILGYSFLLPLLIILVLILIVNYSGLGFSKIMQASTLISILLITFFKTYFSDDKFLTDIENTDDKLYLTYFNRLAEKDQLMIRSKTIVDVKFKKKIFLLRDFNSITFTSKNNSITFKIFETDLNNIKETIAFFYNSPSTLK